MAYSKRLYPLLLSLTGGTGEHRAVLRHDQDWGGPAWSWAACSCGWESRWYGDIEGGTIADTARALFAHTGDDPAADLPSAITAAQQSAADLHAAADALTAATGAQDALDALRRARDTAETARAALNDAHLLALVQNGEL